MGPRKIHFENELYNKKEIIFGALSSSWGITKGKKLQLKNVSNLLIYDFNKKTKEKHLIAKIDKHYINLELKVKESKDFPYCDLLLNNTKIYSRKYCFTCILECNTTCFVQEKIEKL